jgi:hypothetical protein
MKTIMHSMILSIDPKLVSIRPICYVFIVNMEVRKYGNNL